jgi:hypothetical protein
VAESLFVNAEYFPNDDSDGALLDSIFAHSLIGYDAVLTKPKYRSLGDTNKRRKNAGGWRSGQRP